MDACQVKQRQSSGSFNISPTQTEITSQAKCERAGKERILFGRRRRIGPAALCLLLAATLFSGRAMASVTASISGTVKDQSGSVISGATVTASNVETGTRRPPRPNGRGLGFF